MKDWLWKVVASFLLVTSVSVVAAVLTHESHDGTVDAPTDISGGSAPGIEQSIYLLTDGREVEITMEDYLTGVLLCEIPSDFHSEAKKAQAVAARTYALRTAKLGVKHGKGIVCAEPGCCQGFISAEDYITKWGNEQATLDAKKAVRDTEGIVVTYQGKLIDATYFSCSGGTTEDAIAVWGADIPYLRSVESPGEEQSVHFLQTLQFTPEEFCALIGDHPEGYPSQWFSSVIYTEGKGVESMRIGGTKYDGTTLRAKLGLRSTNFSLTATSDSILITTLGFGHRVGMSQYGADAMACSGSSYEEILKHYYSGVSIVKAEENSIE